MTRIQNYIAQHSAQEPGATLICSVADFVEEFRHQETKQTQMYESTALAQRNIINILVNTFPVVPVSGQKECRWVNFEDLLIALKPKAET